MNDKQLKSFKDLVVWQKAVDLAVLIYSATEKFPKSELYGITNQMRRSVISISSNIAEGFKRSHQKEKLQFYNVAYASTSELESQIEVSRKLDFLDSQSYQKLSTPIVEVGKMIDGLVKSTTNRQFSKSYILNPIFLFIFLTSTFYILTPSPAFSAGIFFETDKPSFLQGDEFLVNIYLDTTNESVNAIEGEIIFPVNLLEMKNTNDGNTSVSFWIEKPHVTSPGAVAFSGIIPGGLTSAKSPLFSMVFRAKNEGVVDIKTENIHFLKNDGTGTEVKVKSHPITLFVSKNSDESKTSDTIVGADDLDSPEGFNLEIANSRDMFDGKNFLVFVTQDKGSGIDHYEVREGFFGAFIPATSPYVLQNQKLSQKISVKAIDKKGNERVIVLYPANVKRNTLYLVIFILLAIVVLYRGLLAKKYEKIS
ncbi:MAG: four helix bundle protein [bacterium]|nr:four helix bundle protein [bacterium]